MRIMISMSAVLLFALLAAPAEAQQMLVPAGAQQTIRCESVDGLYRECRADGHGRIMVTRQISSAECIEGRTWGYRDGHLWVNNGCRAEFTFTGGTALPARTTAVVCESVNGRRANCPVDTRGGVVMARQISDNACIQGQSWGYSANGIWVDRGCRAEFSVGSNLVASSRFGRVVLCESIDGRRAHCPADTRTGIQIVRQISRSNCDFERDWGYDANGIWVNNGCRAEFAMSAPTILCESIDGRRNTCRVDTAYGVELHRQISNAECVRNRTWGFDRDGIWVTSGCRAEFALGDSRSLAMAPAVPVMFLCESEGGRRNVCRVDTRYGITLQRQLSSASCIQNRTWGYDANGVWVTEGCRAEFAVGDARGHLPMTSAAGIPTVLCESIDGRRNVCRADTRHGVRVQRQISNSDCVLNRTWGYDSAGIWVTNGCRAEFALDSFR
jgi:ribosomal protein L37AE/L43A